MGGDYSDNLVLISLTLSTFNNKSHNSCDEKIANRNKKATEWSLFKIEYFIYTAITLLSIEVIIGCRALLELRF
ncbi:hypothetical protein FLM53_07975 [Vibrio sp. Scap24]|nr:hypothetical protein [Vibrio sp. Scap16]QLE92992.1 hypothetical protein FLM53_07975 [Vibrio sp. Scap24]